MNNNIRYLLPLSVLVLIGFIVLYIVVVLSPGKFVVIEIAKENLTVDGKIISKLIVNPEDGFPDLPETAYDGFYIASLKNEILKYAADSIHSIQIRVPDSYIYAIWKPLILTARHCRFKSITIGCTADRSMSQIFEDPLIIEEILLLDQKFDTIKENDLSNRNYDTILPRAVISISPDSIFVKRHNLTNYNSSSHHPMMKDSLYFLKDSALIAGFLRYEFEDRLFVMKSHYSNDELIKLVDMIKDSTNASGRISLQIHPTSSCRQIVKFLRDVNRNFGANQGLKNPNKNIYNYIKFSF